MEMPSIEINYKSPERKIGFWGKYFPSPTYYIKSLVEIVNKANIDAKKGNYPVERWLQDSKGIIGCVEATGGKVIIEGMENYVNLNEPCIFVSNHMSTLETLIFPILIQPYLEMTFVVKSSLVNFPFFGAVMKSRDPIMLERVNPREDFEKVMKEGVQYLHERKSSLLIFPQGTRKKVFLPEEFNSLGIKLAKKAGVPIIPVAVKTDYWGQGAIVKDFGWVYPKIPVHFKFGEPMRIEGNGKAEHAKCVDFIKSNLDAWYETDNK